MKTLIIIPTYNESENIEKLILKIKELDIEADILVVDDNSPDGTSDKVVDLREKFKGVSLIVRDEKMGLGAAYIEGFKKALKYGYEVIIQMDADLSHDPAVIPKLLDALKKTDFVIGSRYVKGGGIKNWSFLRRIISHFGCFYAKNVLEVPIKDFTSGFNAFKTSLFSKLDIDKIKSNGYSFQIELKYKAVLAGFSFKEIPIIFSERTKGKSKISRAIVLEAFFKTIFLKLANESFKNKFYYFSLFSFAIFLVVFRFHNAFSFNPYWGYDGGGHVHYILSLARENKLPSLSDTYLAWHEPLYYILMAIPLKILFFFKENVELKIILKFLSSFQVLLSLATSVIIYKLIKLLTKRRLIIFTSFVLINLLPNFNQASTFLTNELLNYFFIFLIIYYFYKYFLPLKRAKLKNYIILAIIIALGILSKITSVILLIIILGYFLWNFLFKKKKKIFKKALLMIVLLLIIISPWFLYRISKVSSLSINNTEEFAPQEISFESFRVFSRVDLDIFEFPFWYSGGKSFWSMLYGDMFYDYYGTIENKDFVTFLEKSDPQKLIWTSQTGTYVTLKHLEITSFLVFLAIFPAFLMILGFFGAVYKFLKTKKAFYFFSFFIPGSFLASLIYFNLRYPYYAQGSVKGLFIFPSFLILAVLGFKTMGLFKKKWLYLFSFFTLIYSFLLILAFWIDRFNY